MIRILFLSADPIDGDRLKVFEEFHAINRGLRSVLSEDEIYLQISGAMSLKDLQSDFLLHHPNIIHFSGHGSINGKIVFKNTISGEGEDASLQDIAKLFELDKERISCVLLNACYSEEQAEEITKYIDCAIGITNGISDKTAKIFSTTFYLTIAKGRSIEEAYLRGLLQLKYENSPIDENIKLKHRKEINCSNIFPIRNVKESVSDQDINNLVRQMRCNNFQYDLISLLKNVPYNISLREFWEEKKKGDLRNILQNLLDNATESGLGDREIEDINDMLTRVPLILSRLHRLNDGNRREKEEMEIEILSNYRKAVNLLRRLKKSV